MAAKRSANELVFGLLPGLGVVSLLLALVVRCQSSGLTSANEIDKLRLGNFRSKVDCKLRVSSWPFFCAVLYE
jgi:hypothetical protein